MCALVVTLYRLGLYCIACVSIMWLSIGEDVFDSLDRFYLYLLVCIVCVCLSISVDKSETFLVCLNNIKPTTIEKRFAGRLHSLNIVVWSISTELNRAKEIENSIFDRAELSNDISFRSIFRICCKLGRNTEKLCLMVQFFLKTLRSLSQHMLSSV